MRQACQDLRFLHKLVGILVGEVRMQHFQRSVALEVDMLTEIDRGLTPSS
jgi:hypothetical protein